MKNTLFFCLTVFVGAIAGSFIASSLEGDTAHAAAGQATAQQAPMKLAVVDRKKVYDAYNRQKSDMAALEKKKDALQAEINNLADQIKANKDKFDATPEGQREELGRQIEASLADLRAEVQKKQSEIDNETSKFLRTIMEDIEKAIAAIGTQDNYHIIFEADPKVASVIYFSPTVDITSQVIARLNSGS